MFSKSINNNDSGEDGKRSKNLIIKILTSLFVLISVPIVVYSCYLPTTEEIVSGYCIKNNYVKVLSGENVNLFNESKEEFEVIREVVSVISYYTPSVAETDSTPFINARGNRVKEGDVANNCLPFGTVVEIMGEMYEVNDRMNSRYGCNHFDILTFSLREAISIGRVHNVKVKVLSN